LLSRFTAQPFRHAQFCRCIFRGSRNERQNGRGQNVLRAAAGAWLPRFSAETRSPQSYPYVLNRF